MDRIMRALAAGVAAVVVLALVQAATASPVDGKLQDDFQLGPRKYQALKMTCEGQEETEVSIRGEGNADLQLQVFDADGQEIAADFGANPKVTFTPKKTAKFRVVVSNLSKTDAAKFTITAE